MKITPHEFSSRLNAICDHLGLPEKNKGRQAQVATLLGLSKMAVSYWFDEKFVPSRRTREKLCKVMGVSQRFLEQGQGSLVEVRTTTLTDLKPFKYKLISPDAKISPDFLDVYSEVSLLTPVFYPDAFAVVIDDDSMYPIYPKNSLLLINPSQSVIPNAIVAVTTKKEGKLFFRQYIDAGQKRFLTPANNDYQTYVFSDKYTLLGSIVYVQMGSFL